MSAFAALLGMKDVRNYSVLVTGGAGYIGSHVVCELQEQGHNVTVLDNLSKGHREAVHGCRLIVGDYANPDLLAEAFSRPIDFVVHLAASSEVGESVRDPSHYYRNNVARGPELLDAAVAAGVQGFVLSSSAAVYGEPRQVPIAEDHPLLPTNPYGETKLVLERMLEAYRNAHGMRWIGLRYFNAAGAHPSGELGEDHDPESHLIPAVIQAVLRGESEVKVFGTDYLTRDGTCVRDYVHVCDLARAHVAALDAIANGFHGPINLGTGTGSTVLEIVRAVEQVAGRPLQAVDGGRRAGDPAQLIASSALAQKVLNWRPKLSEVKTVVESAWHWHLANPQGYAPTVAPRILRQAQDVDSPPTPIGPAT